MPDKPTCPWCGAEATEWSLLVNRGEWLCGSHKSGKEPYQSVECKNNVLEAENARLQAVVDRLPKMVDGVCIVEAPDMVWLHEDGDICDVTGWEIYRDDRNWAIYIDSPSGWSSTAFIDGDNPHRGENPNRAYSTREVAEKAAKERTDAR